MNVALFKEAQQAYAHGDYETALNGFIDCVRDTKGLSPSDLSKFYHLIGNCYVKSGDPRSAASAYTHALQISPEKRKPALYVNLGTALLGAREYQDALTAFDRALDYPVYATPYKAYAGIGVAQLKLGNIAEAGAAYRQAALDPTNPDPAKALVNLGVCFMELGRAKDAITSYETALEFNLEPEATSKVQANLGQAYLAEGRVNKALEAFEAAIADGSYELSPMAHHDYEIAQTLHDKIESRAPGVLDTGFIPPVAAAKEAASDAGADEPDEPSEAPASGSGHLPVYGEPEFDPFAPQTQAPQAAQEDEPGQPQPEDLASADEEPQEPPEAAPETESEESAGTEGPAEQLSDEQTSDGEGSASERRVPPATRHVSADGVDEDELEKTLVELGIAPEQTRSPWERPEAESAPADGDEMYEDVRDEAGEGADDADETRPFDLSTEKTQFLKPVGTAAGIDIPTGELSVTEADEAADAGETNKIPPVGEEPSAEPADEGAPWGASPEDSGDGFDALGETQAFSPDGVVSEAADSGEPLRLENTDTHMPSPEDTQFFERTEDEIKRDAKQERKKARKSRGVGLKVAIVIIILAVLVVAAGAAAYILGYGYPTQEHVARSYFAAVGNGSDTSQYWADDVDESSRASQSATVGKLNSYHVEAVQRSTAQTTVYVKGTLEEGGQVDYELVMSRKGLSWGIEYVELYFPSQQ